MNHESNMNQLKDLIRYGHIISYYDEKIADSVVRVYHFYKATNRRTEYKAVLVNGVCILCEKVADN